MHYNIVKELSARILVVYLAQPFGETGERKVDDGYGILCSSSPEKDVRENHVYRGFFLPVVAPVQLSKGSLSVLQRQI